MSRKDRDRGPVRFMFLLERSLAKRIESYTHQGKKKKKNLFTKIRITSKKDGRKNNMFESKKKNKANYQGQN